MAPACLTDIILFTVGALDNSDHNPNSTTAVKSFYGTGISLFQFPGFSLEVAPCFSQPNFYCIYSMVPASYTNNFQEIFLNSLIPTTIINYEISMVLKVAYINNLQKIPNSSSYTSGTTFFPFTKAGSNLAT